MVANRVATSLSCVFASAVIGTCGFSALALGVGSVFFNAPMQPVRPLRQAVDAIKSGNGELAAGRPNRANADFMRAQRFLEAAGRAGATYADHAPSPTNFDGVIESELSLGRYFYENGRRSNAYSAFRNAVKTYDQAFPPKDARERDWLRLVRAERYRASFKAFTAWRQPMGMGPTVPGEVSSAFYEGLGLAAAGDWDTALERLRYVVSQTNDLREADMMIGLIYHLQHRRGATLEFIKGSYLSTSGTAPAYTNITIDSARLATYYE